MRIFICEYITGGGIQDDELPQTLVHEGDLMLKALVSDLLDAGYEDLFCTRDIRLGDTVPGIESINPGKNIWETWKDCICNCDAVWIIAPETDGILLDLTTMSEQIGCLLLGCSKSAVELATSKKKTIDYLTGKKIPCVPVIEDLARLPDQSSGWVIKPDDGIGAEDCYLFTERKLMNQYISRKKTKRFIVQEYIRGIPASISMVCLNGHTIVLGCNQQLFTFNSGKGRLNGIVVNGIHRFTEQLTYLAKQICAAIKGLTGYVGVDLILTENGPLVLEINPRLTTAYAGLSQSIKCNPAGIIISAIQNEHLPVLNDCKYDTVTINL